MQTGLEFPIFKDRADITWGQKLAAAHRPSTRCGDAVADHHHPGLSEAQRIGLKLSGSPSENAN